MASSGHRYEGAYIFRGVDHSIEITVNDAPLGLDIRVADTLSGEAWAGAFSGDYVEELTRRTGSYKPFATFVQMLEEALSSADDGVLLELLTYEDLKAMR